jgi:hypothetical protein
MGIKKHNLLEQLTGMKNSTLTMSYDRDGVWLSISDSKVFISKDSLYGAVSDFISYFASIDGELDTLESYLEQALSEVRELKE